MASRKASDFAKLRCSVNLSWTTHGVWRGDPVNTALPVVVVVSEVMPEVMAEVVGRPLQPLFVLSQVNNRLRNEHRHPLLLGLATC
jgi:hypothetical protein